MSVKRDILQSTKKIYNAQYAGHFMTSLCQLEFQETWSGIHNVGELTITAKEAIVVFLIGMYRFDTEMHKT